MKKMIKKLPNVEKIWGKEIWLENNKMYCGKILYLKKGYQCSLHHHKTKDETLVLLKGKVRFEIENKTFIFKVGDFIRVMPGQTHRFYGIVDSEIFEFGTHHIDSDSYRLEKSCKI